jgi:hypothetical protein
VACGAIFVALSFAIKGWAHGVDTPTEPEEVPAAADVERQAGRA